MDIVATTVYISLHHHGNLVPGSFLVLRPKKKGPQNELDYVTQELRLILISQLDVTNDLS